MYKYFFALFVFSTFANLYSQNVVQRSDDFINVLGRKYYIHTVEQGQTLFSIAKAYNVPVEQIILINKVQTQNIKVGDILRIPFVDQNYVPEPITKIDFIIHKVDKHESLFGIAQKYNVSQDEIIKYNPQVLNGIKKGMELRIPVIITPEISTKDEYFAYHIVRNNETLQSIANIYGITVDDILEFNSNNISQGTILTIPLTKLTKEQIYILKYNRVYEPNFLDIDLDYFEDPSCEPCSRFVYKGQTFNIAVALPFFIEENLPLSQEAANSPKKTKYFSYSELFIDFLQGMLVAAKDLEQLDIKIKLHIIDTKADDNNIPKIFNDNGISQMDLIIGPAFTKNYNYIRDFCNNHKINIVSPFSNKIETIDGNPFVFQVNPTNKTIIKTYAAYLSQFQDTSNIIVISDNSDEQNSFADTLHYYLSNFSNQSQKLTFQKLQYSKFIDYYRNQIDSLKSNFIIIPTTNNVQLNVLLNNLNGLVAGFNYKIVAFVMTPPELIQDVQIDWIANLQLHYYTNQTLLIDDSIKRSFDNAYIKNFAKKPSRYSYLGYDVLLYFANNLKNSGKYFQFCLDNFRETNRGVFHEFSFKRIKTHSGFENKSINIIKYNRDYTTSFVNLQNLPLKNYLDN